MYISGSSGQNPGKLLDSVGGTSVNERDIEIDVDSTWFQIQFTEHQFLSLLTLMRRQDHI